MFDFVQNLEIIEQACEQFVNSHETYYNFANEFLPEVAKYPNLRLDSQEVTTSVLVNQEVLQNKIKLHLVNNIKSSENCIVYLHGLSSYCVEGKFLIPFLGDNLSLCVYDSRGHGKNLAQYVTYGLLESEELWDVLKALLQRGFKNIILWGRSMGAVTCLRAIQQHKDHHIMRNIKQVVADSPFSSFKMIATELVCKMVMLPEFIAGVVADAFANKIKEKYGINLKDINFQNITSRAPVIFLYSSKDEMMGRHHIDAITKNFIGEKELCDIEVTHNEQRPKWVIMKTIGMIKQTIKEKVIERRSLDPKKRGLSITKVCSNKYLSMVTPTCIQRSEKVMKPVPHVSFQRRKPNQSKNQTKENIQIYKKPNVQPPLNKFSSADLNAKFSKTTTNRDNFRPNGRKIAFADFI